MISSEKGYLNVVKYLCGKGANTEAKDEKGRTALHYASAGDKINGRTALYLASRNNHFDVVEYLKTKKY